MMRHLVNLLMWLFPTSKWFLIRRWLLKLAGVDVHETAKVCGRGWIYGRGKVSIGEGSWLSPGVVLYTNVASSIVIGKNCDIGPECLIVLGGHLIGSGNRRAGTGTSGSVSIENGCWIGARSVILGGVTIGEGSVVAAGSVVTKNVLKDCLVAGVPAKVKRALA